MGITYYRINIKAMSCPPLAVHTQAAPHSTSTKALCQERKTAQTTGRTNANITSSCSNTLGYRDEGDYRYE